MAESGLPANLTLPEGSPPRGEILPNQPLPVVPSPAYPDWRPGGSPGLAGHGVRMGTTSSHTTAASSRSHDGYIHDVMLWSGSRDFVTTASEFLKQGVLAGD